jgi:hypothetical protein
VNDQIQSTEKHVGRRAVVRTAAHAAWAVPAIQIATSVSANAAVCSANTSAPAHFTVAGGTTTNKKVYTGTYTVANTGKLGVATATITVAGAVAAGGAPAPSGWTATNAASPFTFTRSISACATAVPLNFTITMGNNAVANGVTVTVSP